MAEAGALRVRGSGVTLREVPKVCLSNSQRTNTAQNFSFSSLGRHQAPDKQGRSSPVEGENGSYSSRHMGEIPSIDNLEESLRKLQLQVDSLASSLRSHPNHERTVDLHPAADSGPFSSRWPVAPAGSYMESGVGGPAKTPVETEWFLKPKHLLKSLGEYSALTSLGLPTFATSPVNRLAGLLGSEIASQNSLHPSADFSFPLKPGAPHVIGVKSLLPPKTPVRASLLKRTSSSLDRGRSLSSSGTNREGSLSPANKRSRWLRSRSQSPKPAWRPSSAKANACAQPPPQLGKSGGSGSKSRSSRHSRSRIYRPGTLAAGSWIPSKAIERGVRSNPWTPYSLPSAAISSPIAQELNEQFLQTLAEGDVGRALVEMSPYQRELARLRLESLRMEEAWLLEQKRQQELERTRGPKPKWYEMRNSQFHYEARKNNELLRNSQDLQSVCDYRHELATASKEFRQQPRSTHLESHG
ncbi:uncharacterized protein LOC118087268 isoform X2 [Zootoca vivipara]|uniref:uncharacterized protein LOC118087268 isoform X2 n=1 Tax=Zootoca vivipara TaxID=8524 RepID=UPI00293BF246|nr:uncharacterized protein LOC118087268 isoform X2 [Zootoca vivipara]